MPRLLVQWMERSVAAGENFAGSSGQARRKNFRTTAITKQKG